jgi:hypothetical protein
MCVVSGDSTFKINWFSCILFVQSFSTVEIEDSYLLASFQAIVTSSCSTKKLKKTVFSSRLSYSVLLYLPSVLTNRFQLVRNAAASTSSKLHCNISRSEAFPLTRN